MKNLLLILMFISLDSFAEDFNVILIGDTQQRELFGQPSGFSSKFAQELSSVAVRSSEQELFAKYLQSEIYNLEPETNAIFHLGDLLDYSCESEWKAATDVLSKEQLEKTFLLSGNHDGIFQGNGNYGFLTKTFIKAAKFFDPSYSNPNLLQHFSAVCKPGMLERKEDEHPEFRKKDFFCSYLNTFRPDYAANYPKLKNACDLVEKARAGSLTNNLKNLTANKKSILGTSSNSYNWNFSSFFPSNDNADWTEGFFLQKVVFNVSDNVKIHFLLLDTTNWKNAPSYIALKCNKSDSSDTKSSKCGMVSKKQRDLVDSYFDDPNNKIGVHDFIFLAGHYPIKDLNNETLNWLNGIIESHKAVYLSAHTHYGTMNYNDDKSLKEINIDSLMDAPTSYLKISYDKDSNKVCFEPTDLWEKLDCDSKLKVKDELNKIKVKVKSYQHSIKDWKGDAGETQWRNRAHDAYRTIKDFIKLNKPNSVNCEDKKESFFSEGNRKYIAQVVISCEKQVDLFISQNEDLQKYASCESILGSRVFFDQKKKNDERNYQHIACINR